MFFNKLTLLNVAIVVLAMKQSHHNSTMHLDLTEGEPTVNPATESRLTSNLTYGSKSADVESIDLCVKCYDKSTIVQSQTVQDCEKQASESCKEQLSCACQREKTKSSACCSQPGNSDNTAYTMPGPIIMQDKQSKKNNGKKSDSNSTSSKTPTESASKSKGDSDISSSSSSDSDDILSNSKQTGTSTANAKTPKK